MITAKYPIRFDLRVDPARLSIVLEADVEEHRSRTYYVVKNFHTPGNDRVVLPEISIRKEKDLWVHTDSGQSTDLSMAAGRAIEARGPA